MKKFIKSFLITIIAFFILGTGTIAFAQDSVETSADTVISAEDLEVSVPTLLPNNPFYFLKEWKRGIQSFFTFGGLKKAEIEQKFANERIVELQKLVEEGKASSDVLEKANEKYERAMEKIKNAMDKIEYTTDTDDDTNKFLEKFANQQMLHQRILQRIREQVPEQAFQKIEQVRERHMEKFGEVMQNIQKNKEKASEKSQNNSGKQNSPIICPDILLNANFCINGKVKMEKDENGCPIFECLLENDENIMGCETLWWFDDNNSTCQQKQFCGAFMYLGLKTFTTEELCNSALESN